MRSFPSFSLMMLLIAMGWWLGFAICLGIVGPGIVSGVCSRRVVLRRVVQHAMQHAMQQTLSCL